MTIPQNNKGRLILRAQIKCKIQGEEASTIFEKGIDKTPIVFGK